MKNKPTVIEKVAIIADDYSDYEKIVDRLIDLSDKINEIIDYLNENSKK